MYFGYRTLRDIKKGEEILIDYGDDWESDWEAYIRAKEKEKSNNSSIPSSFRRAIDLPESMFPEQWYVDCIGNICNDKEWDSLVESLKDEKLDDLSVRLYLSTSYKDDDVDIYWKDILVMTLKDGVPNSLDTYVGHEFIAKVGEEIVGTYVVGDDKSQAFSISHSESETKTNDKNNNRSTNDIKMTKKNIGNEKNEL